MQQAVLHSGTLDHDVIGELEPALEASRGDAAMKKGGVLMLRALLAANGKGVLLHLNGEVALAEASNGHADAILVLADARDIVGRVARGLAVKTGERIEQRAEPVEADSGAIKWGKIEVPHDTSSLRSDMNWCPLKSFKPGGLREAVWPSRAWDMGAAYDGVKGPRVLNIKVESECRHATPVRPVASAGGLSEERGALALRCYKRRFALKEAPSR